MQIIDGKKISQEIKDEVKEEVAQLKAEGKDIALAVIQVGAYPHTKKQVFERIFVRFLFVILFLMMILIETLQPMHVLP